MDAGESMDAMRKSLRNLPLHCLSLALVCMMTQTGIFVTFLLTLPYLYARSALPVGGSDAMSSSLCAAAVLISVVVIETG